MSAYTDLARLEALADRVTSGPWEVHERKPGWEWMVVARNSGYPGASLYGVRAEREAAYLAALPPKLLKALAQGIWALLYVREHVYGLHDEGKAAAVCDAALAALGPLLPEPEPPARPEADEPKCLAAVVRSGGTVPESEDCPCGWPHSDCEREAGPLLPEPEGES